MDGTICGRWLLPHPPAAVEAVGGAYREKIAATVGGMEKAAARIAETKPDTVVIITPHGPRFSHHFYTPSQPRVSGDFAAFGAAKPFWGFDCDLELISRLEEAAAKRGLSAGRVDDAEMRRNGLSYDLDHGALVPLTFLAERYRDFRVVPLSLSDVSAMDHYRLGMALREAAEARGGRTAVIASGDLSHKLQSDGPYGYDEAGPAFDRAARKALLGEDLFGLMTLDPAFAERAAQCGLNSYRVLLGTLDGFAFTAEFFSYEGPLGVGYLTGELRQGKPRESFATHFPEAFRAFREERQRRESAPVKLARRAIETYLADGGVIEATAEEKAALDDIACHGLFVSVKIDGHLRGCVGTSREIPGQLCREIIEYAIDTATKDPRFPKMTADEAAAATISVDLLGEAEATDESGLDPKRYGVIVESRDKSALLLPDIAGIDTVEDQLAIARDKAGIHPWRKMSIRRFTVTRYE